MPRVLCINPCPPSESWSPSVLNGITVPGFGAKIKPMTRFDVKGGCDGCEAVATFLLQIQPFLMSFALPMCELNCIMSVIDVMNALSDLVEKLPAPDPTDLVNAIADAVGKCGLCVTGWSIPYICALVRDILDLIIAAFKCIRGLLEKLVALNLKAVGLISDPILSIRKTGECLLGLVAVQRETAMVQLDALGVLINALSFLMTFIGADPSQVTNAGSRAASLAYDTAIEPIITIVDNIISLLAIPRQAAATCAGGL